MRPIPLRYLLAIASCLFPFSASLLSAQTERPFPEPFDTDQEDSPRMSPEEAARAWTVPEGFNVSLFAGEPDVRQPIGMAFDTRGRLWVAENYTYGEAAVGFDERLRDRIVILEDTDGDGRADKRKVFWDQAERLTSVEIGFGGVWALCAPHLLFIPDADGDDRPDGEPVVMLDGWDAGPVRHNVVNGLRWGPDGWLYGRHGILATSRVGTPETPESARTPLNCAIWRFHPTEKRFEVVCQGTTNPWGMDWNEQGELFFINTVIGHLWHVIPGAHYKRMYGEDFNPHLYELIDQTADHVHWDTSHEAWTATRTGFSQGTDAAGGGHAHSGLMIYQGTNWPAEYRGDVFMLNFHGRRLNRDRLAREGTTYTAHHQPDLMSTSDKWFRGIDLASGPDGGVYVLDWSDTGECHDEDGVHRSSGRIYKIVYGAKQPELPKFDLATLSYEQLLELQTKPEVWHARQGRRILQERAARGDDLKQAEAWIRKQLEEGVNRPTQLRLLWCLFAIRPASAKEPIANLDAAYHWNFHVWKLRLATDQDHTWRSDLQFYAEHTESGEYLTAIAASLQRMPPVNRWALATKLAQRADFADDRVLPLMIWYNIEPAVVESPDKAAAFAMNANMPKLTRFTSRRLASDLERNPKALDLLVAKLATCEDAARRQAILTGMNEALAGWRKAPAPQGWSEFAAAQHDADAETAQLIHELSAVFGDGRALDALRGVLADDGQPLEHRRQAIRALVHARNEGISEALLPLLTNADLSADAVRGLAELDLPRFASEFVERFPQVPASARETIVAALITRVDTAKELVNAVAEGKITPSEVSVFALRQMQLLGDAALNERLAAQWPELRLLAADKAEQAAKLRAQLTPETLAAADLAAGHKLFTEQCGKCHRLYGEGGTVGPELTGAQRGELAYWLQNVVDPSATVATSYRLSIVLLKDGRTLNGIVGAQTDRTVALRTADQELVLDREDIEEIHPSELSLMPEGQLQALSADQVRDLIGYLMTPNRPESIK